MAAILAGEAAVRIVPTLKNFHSEVRKGLRSQPHSLDIKVNPDLKLADAQMAEWRKRQELESVKVPVRADFQTFQKDLSQVEHIFQRSSLSKAIRINLVVAGLDALPALAYAAGSAVSGLDALAQSALILPGILGGALASAGALATGIHGVKDAFQAYTQDSDKASDSARKQQDADRDLTSAKRNLQSAIRDQKREIQDLNAEMRRSSLSEADAVLSIQEDLNRLRQGGFKNVTEYQRAVLSLLSDEDRLNTVRTRNSRTIEDATRANREGVQQSDRVQQALDRVAKATEALDESKVSKVSKALEKLAPNAASAVQAIHGLSGEWNKLVQTPTQNALFAGLDKDITSLAQRLPELGRGLSGVASGLNSNIRQIISALGSNQNVSLIGRIFGDTQGGLQNASRGITSLLHGFLQLSASSADFLPRLGDAATKVFAKFDAWTTKISQNGQLTKWIDNGLRALDLLGNSILHIGSIFNSIGAAFDAASGHSGGFLQTLDNITAKLADFLSSDAGQQKLTGYFKGAGDLVKELGKDLKEAKPLLDNVASAMRDWSGILFGIIGNLGRMADSIQRNTGLIKPLVEAYLAFRTVKPIIEGVTWSIKTYEVVSAAVARQGGVGGLLSTGLENAKTKFTGVGDEAVLTSNKIKVAAAEEVVAEEAVTKSAVEADVAVAAGGGAGGKGGKLGGIAGGAAAASGPLAIAAILSSLGNQGLEGLNGAFKTDLFTKLGEIPGSGLWFSKVLGFARGGLVKGQGGPTDDANLVAMSSGEHVTKAKAVNYYGAGLFDDLNNMRIPKHAGGGFQLAPPPPLPPLPTPPRVFGPPLPPERAWGGAPSIGPPNIDVAPPSVAPVDVPPTFAGAGGAGSSILGTRGGPVSGASPSPSGFDFGGAGTGGGRITGNGLISDQGIKPTLPLTSGLGPGEQPFTGGKSYGPFGALDDWRVPNGSTPVKPQDVSGFKSWPGFGGTPPRDNVAGGGNSSFNAYMSTRDALSPGQRGPIDEFWRGKGFNPDGAASPHLTGGLPGTASLPHTQAAVTPGVPTGSGALPPIPAGNTPVYAVAPGPSGTPIIAPSGPVMGQMRGVIDSLVGTPYVWGGFSPAGVDCSGLASIVANIASGRPAFSSRFDTHSELGELTSRGFQPGKGGPGMLTIGWNDSHTAITLPDGTSVASGESGGVNYGGGGSNEPQFNNWMHLPVDSSVLDALGDPRSLGLPGMPGVPGGIPGVGVPGVGGFGGGGGGLPNFLQPQNMLSFFGGQAQNIGSSAAQIGLQFLQGITGINLSPILGAAQGITNGALQGDGSGGGSGGLSGMLGGMLGGGGGGGSALNAIAGGDMSAFVNGQLPLGASPGTIPTILGDPALGGGGGAGGAGGAGGGSEHWRALVRQILTSVGPKYGITQGNEKLWEDAIVKQIGTESGGNPNSMNLHDSNGRGGQQQVGGLLNFLPSTFQANNITGGSFMDPGAQIAAAIPYVVQKWGFSPNGGPNQIGQGVGFAGGGFPDGSALVSHGEYITNKKAVNKYGPGLFSALNSMSIPKKAIGGFYGRFEGGGFTDILHNPTPPQQSSGPLPLGPPGTPGGPPPTPAGGAGQTPGPTPLPTPDNGSSAPGVPVEQPQVAAPASTGGSTGPGATAPAPDPGGLPQVANALAGLGGSGPGGGGMSQPGANPDAQDGQDQRGTLGAAPKSQDHNLPAVSQGIQGAASTIGSLAAMAAQIGISAGTMGAGAPAGAAAAQGIQAGAQMAGQVATGAVNILSSLLVGTATPGTTASASGVPLLPQRRPMQTGVPQVQQQVHNGDVNYHLTNLDDFQRTQQRLDAQNVMPFIGKFG